MSEAPVIRDVKRAGENVLGGVKKLVGGPEMPGAAPGAAPPSPTSADPAVAAATQQRMAAAAAAERKNRGRASTLLTGGAGLSETSGGAPVARKVLLGS